MSSKTKGSHNKAKLSSQDHRAAARQKAEQMRAAADRSRRRRLGLLYGLVAVVVLGLVVAVGISVQSARSGAKDKASGPFGVTGAIALPSPDGAQGGSQKPVTVRVYADYRCPHCAQFEQVTQDYFDKARAAGEVSLELVPIAILNNRAAGVDYSSRAAGAAYCVADSDKAKLNQFNQDLFQAMPQTSLTNGEILQIAKRSIPDDPEMDACITGGRYASYADVVTDRASQDGVTATPSVFVDGKQLQLDGLSPQTLAKAVAEARAAR
ncbi:MAG: hypothetical protein CSA58_05695 [Micrococcales bacterium]|nr:MAG: hypothetical protein CSB46_01890 [Micrococcales bacterium]PIE27142.1 MAG: hypothetical protein CSA58_05695 [Micrococcales bacterium]